MKLAPPLDTLILTLRKQRVILDADLAELYGATTKRLNEQVKRNADRFPEDFMFQLTAEEWSSLNPLRSQIATLEGGRGRHRKYLPFAFTEHGALMAANVLNSPEAVSMSVYVVRAFIKQREILLAQTDVLKRLAQMDAKLLKHDDALRIIWRELQPLLTPPEKPKRRIGFHRSED
ncbi:MAG: ORF6N domain-containing protein [Nitrospirae bacterium]|nr:ORF6N domain-containing protein [Nitrospirota bacterium]